MKLDNIGPMRKPVSVQSLVGIFEQDCFRHSPSWASFKNDAKPREVVTIKCGRCGVSFEFVRNTPRTNAIYCKSCTKS